MNCAEFQEEIVHVLLDQAEAARSVAVRAHALACAACAREAERVGELLHLLRAAAELPASDSFRPRLAARLCEEREAEEQKLARHVTWRDRVQATGAYVRFRLGSSAGVRAAFAIAAVCAIGSATWLWWSARSAAHAPERALELAAAGRGDRAPAEAAPDAPPIASPRDLAPLFPSARQDLASAHVEGPQRLEPPEPAEADPFESPEGLAQLREETGRLNLSDTFRYWMRERYRAPLDPAVKNGLRYLASVQGDDGSWDPAPFGGSPEVRVGATGLALLAFLGNAERGVPGGVFREHVNSGIEYLQSAIGPDGTIGSVRGSEDVVLFNHAVATLALVEHWALVRGGADSALADSLERLGDLGSARRHRARTPGDDVTAPWAALALETARAAGFPAEIDLARAAEDARRYVGTLFQLEGGEPERARFGIAVSAAALDRVYAASTGPYGWRPPLSQALDLLRDSTRREPSVVFFAALELQERGGSDWEAWREQAGATLLALQRQSGAWSADAGVDFDPVTEAGGDIYQTALSILTLSVEHRVSR